MIFAYLLVELILLGFTSLLLTVLEKPIANICIPKGVGETLLPCARMTFDDAKEETKCAEKVCKMSTFIMIILKVISTIIVNQLIVQFFFYNDHA